MWGSSLKKSLLFLARRGLICACGIFMTLLGQTARAGESSSETRFNPPGYLEALPQAQLSEVLADLLRDERVYAGDPDFDYVLGVVALKAEANTIALHALERVVLQSPERAGAWVDLAIAHARLGETETAATLLDYVEETFPVPPGLRAALDNARRQLLTMRLARGWHGEFNAGFGFDSNANSGLNIDRLTLTLDGVPAEFLISPEFRLRSDTFLQLGGRLRRAWETGFAGSPGRFMLAATAKAKDYRNEKSFNLGDAAFQAVYQQQLLGGEAEVMLATQQIRLGGDPLVNIRRLQLGWGRQLAEFNQGTNCRLQAGPENESRTYPNRHYLDGNIGWLGLQLVCVAPGSDTALSFKAGSDKPDSARPGGKTHRKELTLMHRTVLWQQWSGEFSMSASRSRDADGYSPVLESNSRRHIDRYYANATVYWPVSHGVEALASFEVTRQNSNIAIFDQSGRIFMLGARYRY